MEPELIDFAPEVRKSHSTYISIHTVPIQMTTNPTQEQMYKVQCSNCLDRYGTFLQNNVILLVLDTLEEHNFPQAKDHHRKRIPFDGGRHVVQPCFYSSPERTKKTLALKRESRFA